jgi:RHS repeat-associated protein
MYREDGEEVWTCELNSYGKVRNWQGKVKTDCPFRYQGQYEDAETGLYYNRFRYYSPEEGIYLSQDPIGLDGGLYGYVFDTNSCIDEFGLAGCPPSLKRQKQIRKNANAGKKWEKNVTSSARKMYGKKNVGEQVVIRPFEQNGKTVNYTVRVDNTITGKGHSPRLIDAKASTTAGYTKNQKKGYPLIAQNGGIIESGPMSGTKVAPTRVERIDPSTIGNL